MRWEDERYVRLYTRDTVTWKLLPWQAKALLPLILRKLDRAGMVDIDSVDPVDAVCALTDLPQEVVAPGLAALMKNGILQVGPAALVMPKFVEAQEAKASDKARQIKARELARDLAASQAVTPRDEPSQDVTKRHAPSRAVTSGHTASQPVTPSLAEPCLAVPSEPSLAEPDQLPSEAVNARLLEVEQVDQVEQLREAWNTLTSEPLPRWSDRGKVMKARATAALKRRPLEQWREIFARIERSSFLRGSGGWKAHAEWALRPEGKKPEPAARILEGAFDDAPRANGNGPPLRERDVGRGGVAGKPCAACSGPADAEFNGRALCYPCAAAETEAA